MARLIIHHDKVDNPGELIELCPFDALEVIDGRLESNAGCKMCKLCVKNGPEGVFEYVSDAAATVDKRRWNGIAVYVDHDNGSIHPVTYELIGKAREMAAKINHPVYCLFMGKGVADHAPDLLAYGVDEVCVYDDAALDHFRIEPYAAVMEDFISRKQPSIVLVGGTTVGRSLAPRVAARFRTGLTADCTILDVQENSDLDQIRPAYGGNIMAHIRTPNHRPQFATVRYKIFSAPECVAPVGRVTHCPVDPQWLDSRIRVLVVREKEVVQSIEEAEVVVAAGRGVTQSQDMAMIRELADRLGGRVAATRPLIEAGWVDPKVQIGLSGRTVKPKLIITCGISGSVQFAAGMNNADRIIAINNDPRAPIFDIAHIAVVGDLYEVIPRLIDRLNHRQTHVCTASDIVAA